MTGASCGIDTLRFYPIAGAVPPTTVVVKPYEGAHALELPAIHLAMQTASLEICVHGQFDPFPEGTNYPAENLQVSFYNHRRECGSLLYRDVCTVAMWLMELATSPGTIRENRFFILVGGTLRGWGTMELTSLRDGVAVA